MRLKYLPFSSNTRIQNAAEDAPPMRRGETNREAVRILQQALVLVHAGRMRRSIRADGTFDGGYGGYGGETVAAVARFQGRVGLVQGRREGDGVTGRFVLSELDKILSCVGASVVTATAPLAESRETLGPGSVQIPRASDMFNEYRRFRDVQGKPCGQGITNQCAIRMSVALMRCDIGFYFDRSKIQYTHSAEHFRCRTGVEHNASASRLVNYLKTIWTFRHYPKVGHAGQSASQIMSAIANTPGIIYFEDCFGRANNTAGDHIDYWNGTCVMNDLLNYNGPGEQEPGNNRTGRWFRNSPRNIWFLPLGA